jgi:hypothetical protein
MMMDYLVEKVKPGSGNLNVAKVLESTDQVFMLTNQFVNPGGRRIRRFPASLFQSINTRRHRRSLKSRLLRFLAAI